MIFTIAILSRSLMSLGYMILCIPLFIYLKDFFYQDKKGNNVSSWINPLIISYPLMYFSFIDIALQIFYQIPFDQFPEVPPNERYMGFDKIYDFNYSIKGI